MPELTFRSAGVSTREIDLSGPSATTPVGVPAGIIGTALKGPAFVPVTVGSYRDFVTKFGTTDGEKFGPLAVYDWFLKAQSATYLRVLGVGDGKTRNTSGTVTNAGFIVGERLVQESGIVSRNTRAVEGGPKGRTHFLGCLMSASAGSTIFNEAGLQANGSQQAVPILRAVIMAASGVSLMLSGATLTANSTPLAVGEKVDEGLGYPQRGDLTGTVNLAGGKQEFVMLLNGHIDNRDGRARNALTASFDPQQANYFGKVFNTDPLKIEEKGHYLYSSFDIHPSIAVVTGTNVLANYLSGTAAATGHEHFNHPAGKWYTANMEPTAFITTSSLGRNGGSATVPNYENFQDRFSAAKSPFFISQTYGSSPYDLFRVHQRNDGNLGDSLRVKISIRGLTKQANDDSYGRFDILVRKEEDSDALPEVLEQFLGLSLDPSNDRFIAKVVGDRNVYFDFDQSKTSQRLVTDGDYANNSSYIRIEQSSQLRAGQVPKSALPFGFRGPDHLVTSGSTKLIGTRVPPGEPGQGFLEVSASIIQGATQPPLQFRQSVSIGPPSKLTIKPSYHWGVLERLRTSAQYPNDTGEPDRTLASYRKFFPSMMVSDLNFSVGNNAGAADSDGSIIDSDRFANNKFTLERVKVTTTGNPNTTKADSSEWVSASYVRGGGSALNPVTDATPDGKGTRAFKLDDLGDTGNKTFAKFTCLLQGGFDGTNIFDEDKSKLLNVAAKREMDDSTTQGGVSGPTVAAHRKAIDILGSKTDSDIKLLAIPGLRHTSITDYAISSVQNRFDCMYIMDIEERDNMNTVVTASSEQQVDVTKTVADFNNRTLNTSFAAAYFPDTVVTDPTTQTNVRVPPSVAVLGAFALNDAIGHPWFAPAGFARGALNSSNFASVELSRCNLDDLYDAKINPITDFPGTNLVVWGQKTLLQAASSLDRVNVRRLLIEVRRQVRDVARSMLFEPNREETLARFSSLVNPILSGIQAEGGVDRYKVIIDSTTTTQADVENNTIRGNIYLQPTRTAEFISLDFVVTNAGDI